MEFPEREDADEQSRRATSKLFNWHRASDGGLWLDDDGNTGTDDIRRLQQPLWIIDQFRDLGGSALMKKIIRHSPDLMRISEWIDEVQRYRLTGRRLSF